MDTQSHPSKHKGGDGPSTTVGNSLQEGFFHFTALARGLYRPSIDLLGFQSINGCPLLAISGHSKDAYPNLHTTADRGQNCLATPFLLLLLATGGSHL